MLGHETIGMELHVKTLVARSQDSQVIQLTVIGKEKGVAVITQLHYIRGDTWQIHP